VNLINKREKEFENKIKRFLAIIILVTFIGSYFGLSNDTISWIVEWIISLMVGFILSFICGSIIESFTDDILKKISITIPIGEKYGFSITLFAIVTFLLKLYLFGL